MKKIVLIFMVLLCVAGVAVAQIPESLNVVRIGPEEGKTDSLLPYTMTIEYLPATGEAFFTFSIKTDWFEQSEAMTTIRDRAEKFILETTDEDDERLYYEYKYRGADTTKYDAVTGKIHYVSRIGFGETSDSF